MSSVYRPSRAADIGSGGKLVRSRRAAVRRTPYDRPPVASSPNPTSENPNWLSRLIYSPTRTIASGAGKLLSSVFSTDSSSCSSSSGSDDDDGDVSSRETDVMEKCQDGTAEIIIPNGSEDMTEMSESKRKIEQLLMQETFSREECDRLIRIIKSRVEDSAMAADTVDKGLIELPSRTIDSDAMPELCSTAVNEAKKWLEKKKLGSNSKSEVDLGPCNLNTDVLSDFVEGEVGSPAEVAKLYMQNRPPWASPSTSRIGYKSTSPTGIQLFKEGTPYSLGFSSSSPSKIKRDSPASGSWSVSEELRKVRSKATEEMLRSLPSSKIDWSSFALEHKSISSYLVADDIEARIRDRLQKSTQALDGSVVLALGATKTHVTKGTQELRKKAMTQNPTVLVTEHNQNVDSNRTVEESREERGHQPSEDMQTESHSAAGKMDGIRDNNGASQPLNSITRGNMQDIGLGNENCTTSKEVDMTDEIVEANGFPPSATSLSAGHGPPDTEHNTGPVSSDNNKTNSISPAEADVNILTEASTEIPTQLESDVLPSGSQNGSSSMGNRNVSEDIQVTSKQDVTSKANGTSHKHVGKKLTKYNRRGTGRGRPRARVNKD